VGGVRMFTRAWLPAREPHAVVVISHGFDARDHGYAWVAEAFVSRGLAAYALDHRGRGDRIDEYVADLVTFIGGIKAREPGLPVFLLAPGAGGVISCVYALEHQGEITGLICEGFRHEVPPQELSRITLPVLILDGTDGQATNPSGGRQLYERAASTDKMLKFYEGRLYDLLSGAGRQQVMTDVQNWIDAHLGTDASRSPQELRA